MILFPDAIKKITRGKQRVRVGALSPTAGNEIVYMFQAYLSQDKQELHETAKVDDPQINLADNL